MNSRSKKKGAKGQTPRIRRPAKPKAKAGSRKEKKASKMPRLSYRARRIIVGLFTLGVLSFLGFFFFIDSLVAKRLALGAPDDGSRVFSDIQNYRKGQTVYIDSFRAALVGRNYRSVSNQPSDEATTPHVLEAGEYQDSNNQITVVSRTFEDLSGHEIPSVKLTLLASKDGTARAENDFSLEPVALSQLGARETRASRFIPYAKIPQHLREAVIAIEDERFFRHFGIDPTGILRALITNITHGRLVQGGSTITQQLAKNLFFSPRRSLLRKLMEIPAALSLEFRLSKEEILELYLNEVYLGQDGAVAIHGVGEAAHSFFWKKC